MKKQVIIIHGGNAFATHKNFLEFLKGREVTRQSFLPSKRWKNNLARDLGEDFEVLAPRMPDEQNAKYAEWKIWFERMLPFAEEKVVLLGHSLGGIFLAKYLSENNFPRKIRALFLVAAPYFETSEKNDFYLSQPLKGVAAQCNNIHLFQSQDDPEVPFADVEKYQKAWPAAKLHSFQDRRHFRQEHFPEIVEEIKKNITKSKTVLDCEMMQISKEQFESWVAEAIDTVPEKFQEKINNLTFFVEDYPTQEQLKKARLSGRGGVLLLGFYEGYHQAKRLNVGPVFPDRITLFQKPLESLFQTEAELKKQIFQTVQHEIAHHFGSDEQGARKASKRK